MIMSEVVSFRVKKSVKKLMSMVDIDWRREIERFIEQKAKMLLREKILKESEELLNEMLEIDNYSLIREDRDER